MATEGQTAIGPNGERAVFRGGQWVVMPQAPQMPADPSFPYQGAQAQAQAANTGAEAQVNQATIPAQITSANADATTKTRQASTAGLPEGFMWGPDGKTAVPIPGYTRQVLSPEVRAQAIQAFTDADALERIAQDLEGQYDANFKGRGLGSVGEYSWFGLNPTAGKFNDTADQARGYVKRGLGFTGGEGNTIGEIQLNYGPYLPQAGDTDARIVNKIKALRNLANDARTRATAVLGGAPDARGNIVPSEPQFNALNAPRVIAQTPGTAGFMATTKGEPVDPQYQAEYTQWVTQNMGRFTPEQYAQFRSGLDEKYNYGATADYIAEGQRIADQFKKGGSQNLTIPPQEAPMSGAEQIRNSLISNPVGAGAAGYLDMAGFGGVSALAGDKMQALGDEHPLAMAMGQIGGSITGTGAVGKLGAQTLGRLAPKMLGGGKVAQFGRNLAEDAVYSGAYGGVTEGDPLTGAALGVGGSAVGQGVGKGLGRAIGGIDLAPQVQRLRNAGVQLTTGQLLGGIPRRLEDAFTSFPGVGDMAGARRLEGLKDFNRAAFGEAGSPIGATVQNIGEQGVEELLNQAGNAYDSATAGVNVPLDNQFISDLAAVVQRGQGLPDDLRPRFGKALENRVAPISDAGQMTGDTYQQAFRGLKGYRSEVTKPGFEQDYRDALTQAMDALTAQMQRGGGDAVVQGLGNADQAYRGAKTLEAAVRAARNGSRSGEVQVFAPSQLNDAASAAAKKYGGGRQMAQLIDDGQSVLPSQVPDSGTGRRLATMALPSVLGGSGAALGGYADGGEGVGKGALGGLGLAALLMAGGTKGGQKAIEKALVGRPVRAQILGRQMRKRSGLFGAAALPLFLEAGL